MVNIPNLPVARGGFHTPVALQGGGRSKDEVTYELGGDPQTSLLRGLSFLATGNSGFGGLKVARGGFREPCRTSNSTSRKGENYSELTDPAGSVVKIDAWIGAGGGFSRLPPESRTDREMCQEVFR